MTVDHTGLSRIEVLVAQENLLSTSYSKVVGYTIKFSQPRMPNIFKVKDISRIENLSYPAKAVAFKMCNNRIFVQFDDIIACR